MRVVPHDGLPDVNGGLPYRPEPAGDPPITDHLRLDAMRSWLFNGIHLVDRRRRFGHHSRARELLVVDRENASEPWQNLAAALQRHTLRGGLAELSTDLRRVITLAYLEGRTNRQIASTLGVSVTTVRRRIWVALGLLEAYIGRTGAWLSAFIVAGAIHATRPITHGARWVIAAAGSTDRVQRLVTVATAGAVSAAVLGTVALTSGSATPHKPLAAGAAPSVKRTGAGLPTVSSNISLISPSSTPLRRTLVKSAATGTTRSQDSDSETRCQGKPTNAPPPVPVGPRGTGSKEPPVTHSDPVGCHD